MRQSKIQLTPVAFLPSRLFPSLSLFNLVSWAFTRIHFGGKIPENFEIIKKGEKVGPRQGFRSVAFFSQNDIILAYNQNCVTELCSFDLS